MYSFTRVVIGPEAREDADGGQERRQDHEDERDAVHADLVLDPEEADPADLLDELEAHGRWVEREHEHDGEDESDGGDRERRPADGRQPIRGDEGEHERADEWGEDREREDVELADVDHQRASQMKRSAIAMRPRAMPSA